MAEHIKNLDHSPRHITPQELFGLKAIVMYIHALPVSKKFVPPALRNPVNLIRDIRNIVNDHKEDTVEQAATGKQVLPLTQYFCRLLFNG